LKDLDGVQGYKVEEISKEAEHYAKRNWLPIAMIVVGVGGLIYFGIKYRQSKINIGQ
jgi:hypothetical protein